MKNYVISHWEWRVCHLHTNAYSIYLAVTDFRISHLDPEVVETVQEFHRRAFESY